MEDDKCCQIKYHIEFFLQKKEMFLKKRPITNKLTVALDNDSNLPVTEILKSEDLLQSIRNEVPQLLSYFKDEGEKHLQEVFDFALSDKLNEGEIDFRYNRNASNLLSTVARNFQEIVKESEVTLKAINDFMENKKYNQNPEYAGHFQRIIQNQQYSTSGSFIKKFPNIFDFLLQNLHISGYEQLLVSQIVDFYDNLKDSNIFSKILDLIDKDENIHALFVFSDIMRDQPDFKLLYQKDIIERLIQIGIKQKPKKGLLFYEIFNAINKISVNAFKNESKENDEATWPSELKKNYAKEFTFSNNDKVVAYVAFPYFGMDLIQIDSEATLKAFLEPNIPTTFALAYLNCVKKMPVEDIEKYIVASHFIDIINDLYDKLCKENQIHFGYYEHIASLCIRVSSKNVNFLSTNPKCDINKYNKFLVEKVMPHNDVIKEYKRMLSDDDDEEEEDS